MNGPLKQTEFHNSDILLRQVLQRKIARFLININFITENRQYGFRKNTKIYCNKTSAYGVSNHMCTPQCMPKTCYLMHVLHYKTCNESQQLHLLFVCCFFLKVGVQNWPKNRRFLKNSSGLDCPYT